jgi:hypothetical protein
MRARYLFALLLSCPPALVRAQATTGMEGPERVPRLVRVAPERDAGLQCSVRALEALGWRLQTAAPGGDWQLHGGTPCRRASLAEAQAQGDLRATLPADPGAARDAVERLLQHPASHCAFSFRLGDATRRAVDRLVANRGFRFSALQTGWIGFGAGGARRDGWRAVRSFGRGFVPASTPSTAIAGFYQGTVRAECGVGRQIAQYAALHELFGPQGMDAAFEPEEIVLGTFATLEDSRSVLLGRGAGTLARDGRGAAAAALGRQAFAGRPGFVFHVLGRETLDDVNNQAENFVVYDVSPDAAAALEAAGGFEPFNRQARELWELSRPLGLTAQRVHERLLFHDEPVLWDAIDPRKHATLRRMRAILDQPFFRGFRVYVHPKGVKPLAYHFARLLDRNPRTPFRVELGNHNLHGEIYRRWLAQHLAGCAGGEAPRAFNADARRTRRHAEKSQEPGPRTMARE